MRIRGASVSVWVLAAVSGAASGSVYDERLMGDLSDDRFSPTVVGFDYGINLVNLEVGRSGLPGGDRDYFSIEVGPDETLLYATLFDTWNPAGGSDRTVFIGLAFDDFFDFDPDTLIGDGLAGFLVGSGPGDITDFDGNMIPQLSGTGQLTLGPGSYTFWVQQTGPDVTAVSLGFTLVPGPGGAAAIVVCGCLWARRRW